jgi:hypothetical protein
LNKAGADVLLLDLAGNGGGSDWVGAAARMISPKPLRAQPLGLIRHPDFARRLKEQAEQLRTYAAAAQAADERALLTRYARQADAAAAEISRPCDRSALWDGREPGCRGVVTAGLFAGGWSADPLPERWRDRPWAQDVERAAGYKVRPGIFRGPLIVLVDGGTASASEQFVAQLQAAEAAVVAGAPTHGSGCGYITGSHGKAGSETVLKNSGGKLFMPNCARFLPGGRNEVGGLEPDILLPFRSNDTPHQKAARLAAALPRVMAAAGASARSE